MNNTTTPPSIALTNATLTFATPATAGSYELRFFVNDSSQQLATSGPITVTPSTAQLAVNGVSPPGSVSAVAGSTATIALTGGPGNPGDWLGCSRSAPETRSRSPGSS